MTIATVASGADATSAKINEIIGVVNSTQTLVTPTGWTTATFVVSGSGTAWTGTVASSQPAGYRLEGYTVWFRGLLVTTNALSANSNVMTLPVDLRPASGTTARLRWASYNTGIYYRFNVADTGVVSYIREAFLANPSAGDYFMLDGMAMPI